MGHLMTMNNNNNNNNNNKKVKMENKETKRCASCGKKIEVLSGTPELCLDCFDGMQDLDKIQLINVIGRLLKELSKHTDMGYSYGL